MARARAGWSVDLRLRRRRRRFLDDPRREDLGVTYAPGDEDGHDHVRGVDGEHEPRPAGGVRAEELLAEHDRMGMMVSSTLE